MCIVAPAHNARNENYYFTKQYNNYIFMHIAYMVEDSIRKHYFSPGLLIFI